MSFTWINNIAAWARSKNITTHTIGAAIVAFAFAYTSSPELRNYIGTIFTGFPVVVTKIGVIAADVVAGVTLWRNYSHSSSASGTLARANEIKDQPDAPTASQVDAATTK